jgi:hypothetical protein
MWGPAVMFILLGLIQILGVCLRWRWVTSWYKVARVYRVLGKAWATRFYVGFGAMWILLGILLLVVDLCD